MMSINDLNFSILNYYKTYVMRRVRDVNKTNNRHSNFISTLIIKQQELGRDPYCLVLVGSRNGFECDIAIKLK